ncbi:MAG: chromosomal replication initiator protein DnaA [Deltaproteobacteria bacterium]
MSINVNSLWEKALPLIKSELTQIGFDTWIKTITPISIDGNNIIMQVPADFYKGMLESRYSILIKNAIKQVSLKEYDLLFISSLEELKGVEEKKVSNQSISYNSTFLNPKYVFDTFVVGNSNRFAHAASLAVAEAPASAYNPLFLYGGVGLGKTHLMHAIGHYILQQNPSAKVLYVSSEHFTNELINAIKDDKNKEFRAKYRNIDVLLIDDIQFIAGKERTQEEFFHTFNALYEANKQLIISSDKPPKDIVPLEDRLKSRFEWGLICDIQAPDLETRIAILRKKVQLEKLEIPNEVLSCVAGKINSNIRELEGAINRIVAYSTLNNKQITPELAEEAIKDILSHAKNKVITSSLVISSVAKYFNLKIDDFKSPKRNRDIAYPRQIAMYICREIAGISLPKIGEDFGGRDHTTVIHAYEKISKEIRLNSELQIVIDDIVKSIKNI